MWRSTGLCVSTGFRTRCSSIRGLSRNTLLSPQRDVISCDESECHSYSFFPASTRRVVRWCSWQSHHTESRLDAGSHLCLLLMYSFYIPIIYVSFVGSPRCGNRCCVEIVHSPRDPVIFMPLVAVKKVGGGGLSSI